MKRFEIENFSALRLSLLEICAEIGAFASENTVFDCKLVIDELVSNVLCHGGGKAYVKVERRGAIRIAVRGERAFRPPEKSTLSPADAERGRGLYLVDALVASRDYSEEDGIVVTIPIE